VGTNGEAACRVISPRLPVTGSSRTPHVRASLVAMHTTATIIIS
jgi:hypothetical protein